MKNLTDPSIQKYRNLAADQIYGTPDSARSWGGAFEIPRNGVVLRVIASRGRSDAPTEDERWEHVSISTAQRCPTWDEMEFIKHLFFERHETVMQLHVPRRDHINNHPYCLHLWRPTHRDIPRPPARLVGVQL